MTDTSEAHSEQKLNTMEHAPEDNEPLSGKEILGWAEFCCWTVVVLIPFLLFVNGPAVSFDQLVVRWALSIVAASGGLILTIRRLVVRRRSGNYDKMNNY